MNWMTVGMGTWLLTVMDVAAAACGVCARFCTEWGLGENCGAAVSPGYLFEWSLAVSTRAAAQGLEAGHGCPAGKQTVKYGRHPLERASVLRTKPRKAIDMESNS